MDTQQEHGHKQLSDAETGVYQDIGGSLEGLGSKNLKRSQIARIQDAERDLTERNIEVYRVVEASGCLMKAAESLGIAYKTTRIHYKKCRDAGLADVRSKKRAESISDITKQTLELKLRCQNYQCSLTGENLTPSNTTVDHNYPVSRGGAHSIDNVSLVTWQANRSKGTMTYQEFLDMCLSVVSHARATGRLDRPRAANAS